MKKHALTMSVAVLSAALLLGCQEQGSGPVGPDGLGPAFSHKDSHNPGRGNGDVTPIMVDLSGGMRASDQPVVVQKDNERELVLRGDGKIEFALAMVIDVGSCEVTKGTPVKGDDEFNALIGRVVDESQDRTFNMTVDKTSLNSSSDKHQINTTWTEMAGDFSLRVGTLDKFPQGGSVTVTVTKSDDDTYTFIGGGVLIWDRTGRVRDHVKIKCVNKITNTITVTVK